MLLKIEPCSTAGQNQPGWATGATGEGQEIKAVLPQVLVTLCFATVSVSVNVIDLVLIKQQLRAVILMQFFLCIMYLILILNIYDVRKNSMKNHRK